MIKPWWTDVYYSLGETILDVILLAISLFTLYLFFWRTEGKKNFIIFTLPPIVFGAICRVLSDTVFPKTYYLVTPGIWILFGTMFYSLFRFLKRNARVYIGLTIVLFFFLIPFYLSLHPKIYLDLIIEVALVLCVVALVVFVFKQYKFYPLFSHMVDSVTSSYVLRACTNLVEEHYFPRLIFQHTKWPFWIVFAKFIFISIAIIVIDSWIENKDLKDFLIYSIFAIGLGPAIRNFLEILVICR